MKNKLLSLIASAVIGLGSSAWAAPHDSGGFASRGGQFGVSHSGDPHAAPAYDDQSAYVGSDQYGSNATIREVQSELAKRRYYRGAIDGIVGDETQAALARYQEDHDLSVTGTLTAATLQSLGLARTAS
jgi:peptidoglycan hydrolase-like protein with peptidoglycan-binding domain